MTTSSATLANTSVWSTFKDLKSIDSSVLRQNWKEAANYVSETAMPLIVKTRNAASHVILDIDEYEDMLSAKRPEYLADIAESRAQHKRGEVYSFEDVFGKIK